MRNRKRMLSLILAGVMGMSTLLAGCGTTDAGTGDAAVDTAVDTAERAYPATIEPQQVNLPVIAHQFFELGVGIIFKALPYFGIFFCVVTRVPVFGWKIGPPVIR